MYTAGIFVPIHPTVEGLSQFLSLLESWHKTCFFP